MQEDRFSTGLNEGVENLVNCGNFYPSDYEQEHDANVEQPVIADLVEEAGEDLQLEIEEVTIS
jgi:hypothetical protein